MPGRHPLTGDGLTIKNKMDLIEEEAFMISKAGELPEVAYHASIHYLTEDIEGPGIHLEPHDLTPLKKSVVNCYKRIILRDLDPDNRNKRIYRGLKRAAINWSRLSEFAIKEKIDLNKIKSELSKAFMIFLKRESDDVLSGGRKPSINCSFETLSGFASQLGFYKNQLPSHIRKICLT
jgi:hypothetical protein